MMGRSFPAALSIRWRSSPLRPGIRTSSSTQPVALFSIRPRNSLAEPKVSYLLDEKSKPQNGTAKLDRATGKLTYSPNPGFIGEDRFKYYTIDEANTHLGVENVIAVNVEPIRKGLSPLSVAPNYEGYYLDEATHSDYDAHWDTLGMQWEKFYGQTADVPMMHVGGWYDIYLRGTIENWRRLGALKKSPMRLVIGPWTHHGNTATFAGDVDFGADAAIKDFDTNFHLAWFDYYLKGIKTAASTQAPVRYFLMGTGDGHKDPAGRLYHGGEWRDSAEWPPAQAKAATYYLHANGSLSTRPPAQSEPAATSFQFDPAHPVPTVGGGVSKRLKDGAYDQRERPGPRRQARDRL